MDELECLIELRSSQYLQYGFIIVLKSFVFK